MKRGCTAECACRRCSAGSSKAISRIRELTPLRSGPRSRRWPAQRSPLGSRVGSVQSGMIQRISERTRTPRERVLGGSAVMLTGLELITSSTSATTSRSPDFRTGGFRPHHGRVYAVDPDFVGHADIPDFDRQDGRATGLAEARSLAYRGFHRWGWAAGIFVSGLLLLFRGGITRYLNLHDPCSSFCWRSAPHSMFRWERGAATFRASATSGISPETLCWRD